MAQRSPAWRTEPDDVRTALADLVLGACCAVCGARARAVCPDCRAALVPDPEEVPGSGGVMAARPYDAAMARVVVAWKERGWRVLTPDLGKLVAAAVVTAGPEWSGVDLVPVPTSRRNRRRRGRDHARELAAATAAALGGVGIRAQVVPAVRMARQTGDQSELGAFARRRNLAHAFAATSRAAWSGSAVVVVDDVTTTGATLREMRRALSAVGCPVAGAAVVAAVGPHAEATGR